MLAFKNNLTTFLNAYELRIANIPMTVEFKLGFLAGTLIAYVYANDPPVDGFLLGPARMDELKNLDSQGALSQPKSFSIHSISFAAARRKSAAFFDSESKTRPAPRRPTRSTLAEWPLGLWANRA